MAPMVVVTPPAPQFPLSLAPGQPLSAREDGHQGFQLASLNCTHMMGDPWPSFHRKLPVSHPSCLDPTNDLRSHCHAQFHHQCCRCRLLLLTSLKLPSTQIMQSRPCSSHHINIRVVATTAQTLDLTASFSSR